MVILPGCWQDNNNRYYALQAQYSSGTRRLRTANRSNSYTNLQTSDTNEHIIIYNDENNKVYWDGVEKATVSDLTQQSANPIGLFCRDGGADILPNGRIFYCKITDKITNTLVRDMVPAKRVSDNEIGMYDRVGGEFYLNRGGGTFIGGAETGETLSNSSARRIKKAYVGVNGVAHEFYAYYTPVNYIQSTGTQDINTGFNPNTNTKVELKINLTGTGTLTDYERIIESYNGSTAYLGLKRSNRTTTWAYQLNNSGKKSFTLTQGVDYTLELTNSSLKIDDATYTFTATTYTSSYPIHIFHGNDRYGKLKLYYMKIYSNNVLIRDFIPVLDVDGTPCLYDKVGDKFYYNSGTGTFSYG